MSCLQSTSRLGHVHKYIRATHPLTLARSFDPRTTRLERFYAQTHKHTHTYVHTHTHTYSLSHTHTHTSAVQEKEQKYVLPTDGLKLDEAADTGLMKRKNTIILYNPDKKNLYKDHKTLDLSSASAEDILGWFVLPR